MNFSGVKSIAGLSHHHHYLFLTDTFFFLHSPSPSLSPLPFLLPSPLLSFLCLRRQGSPSPRSSPVLPMQANPLHCCPTQLCLDDMAQTLKATCWLDHVCISACSRLRVTEKHPLMGCSVVAELPCWGGAAWGQGCVCSIWAPKGCWCPWALQLSPAPARTQAPAPQATSPQLKVQFQYFLPSWSLLLPPGTSYLS